MELISKETPDVFCIQENVLSKQTKFNLMNYNGLFKEGHTKYRAHEGVTIFIHETILNQKLILSIPLQAMAAKINIEKDVTIVSMHKSRSHAINENLLKTLDKQFSKFKQTSLSRNVVRY